MPNPIDPHIAEIKTLAQSLPYRDVECPEFKDAQYRPECIRQERMFPEVYKNINPINRFLIERGIVEVLPNADVMKLFHEIYWCVFRVHQLAQRAYAAEPESRAALVQARSYISEIEAAEEEVFVANRRLIANCVKPYYWIGQMWLADFLQEGSKALHHAIHKFDFTRGAPFYPYANTTVQNRMRNYLREHMRTGSIGIHPTPEMLDVRVALTEWKEHHHGEPDNATLAELTGLPEARIKKIRSFITLWVQAPKPPLSLDEMRGDADANLHDFLIDEHAEKAFDLLERSEVWSAINHFSPKAKYIMWLRYVEGRTFGETAEIVSMSRTRVQQIQEDSLRKLKQMFHEE